MHTLPHILFLDKGTLLPPARTLQAATWRDNFLPFVADLQRLMRNEALTAPAAEPAAATQAGETAEALEEWGAMSQDLVLFMAAQASGWWHRQWRSGAPAAWPRSRLHVPWAMAQHLRQDSHAGHDGYDPCHAAARQDDSDHWCALHLWLSLRLS